MGNLAIRPVQATLIIKHPVTGEETNGVFRLVGTSSPQFYNAVNGLVNSDDDEALSNDVKFSQNILASCIVGWDETDFNTDDEGKPIAYSPEEALNLISDPMNQWLANQLKDYVENAAHFFTSGTAD